MGDGRGGKVYIGDLGNHATDTELEKTFRKYGKLKGVFVAKRPPGFAFIEYEDRRDAEDAVNAMDGRYLFGRRIRVELSHGKSRWPGGRPPTHLLRRPAPRYVRSPPRRGSPTYGRSKSRSRSKERRRYKPNKRSTTRSRSPPTDKRRSRRRSRSPSPSSVGSTRVVDSVSSDSNK